MPLCFWMLFLIPKFHLVWHNIAKFAYCWYLPGTCFSIHSLSIFLCFLKLQVTRFPFTTRLKMSLFYQGHWIHSIVAVIVVISAILYYDFCFFLFLVVSLLISTFSSLFKYFMHLLHRCNIYNVYHSLTFTSFTSKLRTSAHYFCLSFICLPTTFL